MSAGITSLPRRVVPRWRDFRTAVSLDECGSITSPLSLQEPTPNFLKLLGYWGKQRTPALAAEILSESVVTGLQDLAIEAANYLCSRPRMVNPLLIQTAKGVLDSLKKTTTENITDPDSQNLSTISSLRRALRSQAHDPIGWCELSRLHAINGQKDKARKAMLTALALGGESRFILRSATRCFLHLDEPETAFHILQRSPRTKKDPWIAAAALATANVLDKRPSRFRESIGLSQNNNIPIFHRAELLASIATIYMDDGNSKKAKKELLLALSHPTENVIAQACWASFNHHLQVTVSQQLLSDPFTDEANTFAAIKGQNWEYALRSSHRWLQDEAFAGRPAIQAAYIRGIAYNDFTGAAQILCKAALVSPGDTLIINNLAFSLASANRTQEARRWISSIDIELASQSDAICLTATNGLIEFREGRIESGRELYRKAAQRAVAGNLPKLRASALYYLAREEQQANTTFAEEAISIARGLLEKLHDPVGNLLLRKLQSGPLELPEDLIDPDSLPTRMDNPALIKNSRRPDPLRL